MQTLEDSENHFVILGGDANSVILNGEHPMPIRFCSRDTNLQFFLSPVLDRITNQVLEQLL